MSNVRAHKVPFPEAIAKEARQRAHYQCCLCKALGVEIHHIVPQAEGGPDTLENAAPLCPSCHETYGANPVKRKFIREARDFWFGICAKRYSSDSAALNAVHAALEAVASRDDIRGLRCDLAELRKSFVAPTNAISIPLITPPPGGKRRLTIRDLLIIVHSSAVSRPPFPVDLLCMRELWPVGKDDYRGIYKDFIRRFGHRTLRHLAMRALHIAEVEPVDHIAENDLTKALTTMHVEAVCMNLVDEGAMGAILTDGGDIRWTAAQTENEP
jgi:hypothetical protein